MISSVNTFIFPIGFRCLSCSSTQPFLEAVRLWSRLAITEQAVAAQLPPGLLIRPHVVLPDLEVSLKVSV